MSQVDGVSDMAPACQLCGLWGEGSEKGSLACLPFYLGEICLPARLDARHFSFSLYATGAFQAATLVLELRGNESEKVHV